MAIMPNKLLIKPRKVVTRTPGRHPRMPRGAIQLHLPVHLPRPLCQPIPVLPQPSLFVPEHHGQHFFPSSSVKLYGVHVHQVVILGIFASELDFLVLVILFEIFLGAECHDPVDGAGVGAGVGAGAVTAGVAVAVGVVIGVIIEVGGVRMRQCTRARGRQVLWRRERCANLVILVTETVDFLSLGTSRDPRAILPGLKLLVDLFHSCKCCFAESLFLLPDVIAGIAMAVGVVIGVIVEVGVRMRQCTRARGRQVLWRWERCTNQGILVAETVDFLSLSTSHYALAILPGLKLLVDLFHSCKCCFAESLLLLPDVGAG